MLLRTALIAVAVLASAELARAQDDPASARQAIERSLPFLEEKGVAWIKERGCVTCHQTTFLI